MLDFLDSLPERFWNLFRQFIAGIFMGLERLGDAVFRIANAILIPLYPFAMIALVVTIVFALLFFILVIIG